MTYAAVILRRGLNHWAFRGAAVISAALAVEYATQFGRSIALSHLLGPTEFGIGSAMVILWVLVDMSTGLGADRYLVQAGEGGSEVSLAAAHTVTVLRNVLSAGLILLMAYPTASLLGVPQARSSFLWLAAVPLIRGFEHLRLSQRQRDEVFWPWALAIGATNIFGLAVVTAAAFVLHDHRAVLWSLAAQAIGLVISTHMLARVPYRLSVARLPVRQALHFGLPLTLNGLALAAIGQADRLAVGSFLGVAALGRYGLATMMFYLPTSLIMRVLGSALAPRLAAAWHSSPGWGFPALFRSFSLGIASVAVLLSAAVALLGSPLTTLLFGHAYFVSDGFFAILSFAVLMRFAKITLNAAGLAMGRTVDIMLSNLPSALGLAATIGGIALFPSLAAAACGAVIGETLGAATAFILLRPFLGGGAVRSWMPLLAMLPLPLLAAAWCAFSDPPVEIRVVALAGAAVVLLATTPVIHRKRRWQPAA